MSDPTQSPKKVYKCPFPECKSVFQRPSKLDTHLKVHANFRHFVCFVDGCGKAYFTSSHLNRHLKTAHLKQEQNDTVYRCPVCFKLFVNRQNLKRHMKRHETKEYFICDYCQEQVPKKDWLIVHMYRHTGVKSFCCDLCPQQFVTKAELTKHKYRHKTYTCEECHSNFSKLIELQHHKRTEHIKEYICDHCSKKFKTKSLIRLHMKIHYMTEKPYLCPDAFCEKSYSKKSNMKAHYLLKHANMTYDCLMCGSKLTTKASLKNHYLKVHLTPPKPFKQKTLANGRKVRKDKGIPKPKILQQISGIQDITTEVSSTITHTDLNTDPLSGNQTNISHISINIANKLTERILEIEHNRKVETTIQLEANRTYEDFKAMAAKKLLEMKLVRDYSIPNVEDTEANSFLKISRTEDCKIDLSKSDDYRLPLSKSSEILANKSTEFNVDNQENNISAITDRKQIGENIQNSNHFNQNLANTMKIEINSIDIEDEIIC